MPNVGVTPIENVETEQKVCPRCGTRFGAAAVFCQLDGVALVAAESERDPMLGRIILDQFRIEEVIGAGGMGTVYRAHQTTLDRDVAIKILHSDLVQNPDAVRRFQREARVSSDLEHPNIVRTSLFGQLPDGSLYIVMELLRGRSLSAALESEGLFAVPRAIHVATQISDAIGEAHVHGVVHRDIKPENVFLVRRGDEPDFVKVLDFGIARFLGANHTALTQNGLVFGTARYISPEAAAGEQTDARSDVYSLATLTYQLLCGETPFHSDTPVALLLKQIHEPPRPLREHARAAHVPPHIADVIMTGLAKNPALRPADANAFGDALREAARASGVPLKRRALDRPSMMGEPSSALEQPVEKTATYRRSAGPRPAPMRSMPPVHAQPSMHRGTPTEDISIAGLPSRRRRSQNPLGTVLIAFFLGATSVIGGAAAVAFVLRPTERLETNQARDAIVVRSRAAFERGDYDAPPGDNVAELTTRWLALDPTSTEATSLRTAAAARLTAAALAARARNDIENARALARRAIAIQADAEAIRLIAELDSAPQRIEVRVEGVPATPSQGETVTLLASASAPLPPGLTARFLLRESGQAARNEGRVLVELPASTDAQRMRYFATYSFTRPGAYDVEFRAGDASTVFALTVRADRRVVRNQPHAPTATPEDPTPPTTVPAINPSDGIDWRVLEQPPEGQPIEPPSSGEPQPTTPAPEPSTTPSFTPMPEGPPPGATPTSVPELG